MRKVKTPMFAAGFAACAVLSHAAAQPARAPSRMMDPMSPMAPPVRIKVHDIAPDVGAVRISVYDSEETFLEMARLKMEADILEGCAEFLLRGLSPGDYSFAIYHDRDSDGVLDRTVFGRPAEPVIFSRNIRPRLRRPTFEETKERLFPGAEVEIAFQE